MPRHDLDPVSLMAGLLLLLVAVVFLIADATSLTVDGRWVGPIVLIAVGGAGLLATLQGRSD
jgi:hypothetical protein